MGSKSFALVVHKLYVLLSCSSAAGWLSERKGIWSDVLYILWWLRVVWSHAAQQLWLWLKWQNLIFMHDSNYCC